LLPGRPPLADEPDLVARHALHTVIEHPVLIDLAPEERLPRLIV
jgi:hypothetical protein